MELKLNTMFAVTEASGLLIVPYGIETNIDGDETKQQIAFNRTLWN